MTRAAWPSYVELLACLQIAQATNGIGARSSGDDKKPDPPAAQEVIDRATSPSSAITARTATGRNRATISRAHRRLSGDQRRGSTTRLTALAVHDLVRRVGELGRRRAQLVILAAVAGNRYASMHGVERGRRTHAFHRL